MFLTSFSGLTSFLDLYLTSLRFHLVVGLGFFKEEGQPPLVHTETRTYESRVLSCEAERESEALPLSHGTRCTGLRAILHCVNPMKFHKQIS